MRIVRISLGVGLICLAMAVPVDRTGAFWVIPAVAGFALLLLEGFMSQSRILQFLVDQGIQDTLFLDGPKAGQKINTLPYLGRMYPGDQAIIEITNDDGQFEYMVTCRRGGELTARLLHR